MNRIIPSNIQAEQILLGSILINSDYLNSVTDFLRDIHFFEPIHQKIYNAIEKMTEKGLIATTITLNNMLNQEKEFQNLGGNEYLNKLVSMSMIIINPIDYGKIIYDLAIRRYLIKIGEKIVNNAYESTLEFDANQQIEYAEKKLYDISVKDQNNQNFIKINKSLAYSLSSINKAMINANHVIGISSGLLDLDRKLSGFHDSDLIIIAGRPSMGKTAFAINLAINTCKSLISSNNTDQNNELKSTGFFSLEMSSEQLSTRILSMYTEIDSSSLRTGNITENKYNKLKNATINLSDFPLFIDDSPALSITNIRTRARRMKRKHNLGILFIDYLQLIKGVHNIHNRVNEISEITQGLKSLAKELKIPIIVLSQLSRAVELREDKKPILSDLRESGSIEQDADIVMFIYREEYYLSRKEPDYNDIKYKIWLNKLNQVYNIADIIIAKHRNGPIGTIQLYYDNQHSKFNNLEHNK